MIKRRLRRLGEVYGARIISALLWPPVSTAVLVEQDESVLTVNFGGEHGLPGGLIKGGEDIRDAAAREVKEETGYDVTIGDLIDIRTGPKSYPAIHFYFDGEIAGGEPAGSWEGTPEWVAKAEMEDKLWRLHHAHVHEYLFPDNGQD